MAIQRFSHFGICVSDLERSRRFYRDLLGFREVTALQIKGGPSEALCEIDDMELHALFLERDGTRIELLHYPSPGHQGPATARPMNQLGLTHFALRVDDLSETLETLARDGVEVLRDTRIANPELESEVAFVTDPDGTRIELIQIPLDPGEPIGEAIG